MILLTFALLLICILLNGCFNELPARQIIYSGGCLAYGYSRNNNSYHTVLEYNQTHVLYRRVISRLDIYVMLSTRMRRHRSVAYAATVIVHHVDLIDVEFPALNNLANHVAQLLFDNCYDDSIYSTVLNRNQSK
jgi:hypothetical protein